MWKGNLCKISFQQLSICVRSKVSNLKKRMFRKRYISGSSNKVRFTVCQQNLSHRVTSIHAAKKGSAISEESCRQKEVLPTDRQANQYATNCMRVITPAFTFVLISWRHIVRRICSRKVAVSKLVQAVGASIMNIFQKKGKAMHVYISTFVFTIN